MYYIMQLLRINIYYLFYIIVDKFEFILKNLFITMIVKYI